MGFKTCLLFVLLTFSMLTQEILVAAYTIRPHICSLGLDLGSCRHVVHRWWFNQTSGSCEPFYYRGCMGNDNNFELYGDCTHTCKYITTTRKTCYWNICD